MNWKAIAVALMVGMFSGAVHAQAAKDTPTTLDGAKVITAADAEKLIEAGAKVFDMRRKAAYVEGHLPKAIGAGNALDEGNKLDLSVIGADKAAPIIFYGHGTDGWKGYEASKAAVAAGYTNVNWLRGGFAEWEGSKRTVSR